MAELKPLEVIMRISPIAGQNGKGEVVMQAEKVSELVRCRDCKWWEEQGWYSGWCKQYQGSVTKSEEFCARGKRKAE